MTEPKITADEALQALQQQAQTLHLSSYDMARWAFSRLSHQGFAPEVIEVQLNDAKRHHFVLKLNESQLDLGADNAAQFTLKMLTEAAKVTVIKPLNLAVLPEAQLAFMCMETAHFDHCY